MQALRGIKAPPVLTSRHAAFTPFIVTNAPIQQRARRTVRVCRAAEDEAAELKVTAEVPAAAAAPAPAAPQEDFSEEVVFYEGSGSNVELALSILLSATLVYLPLTMQSIGRRFWITIKVTNKRIVVTNTSPVFKGQTQVAFSQIKEIRTVPRAFGAWGDMVIFLKDGSRLELAGLEKCPEIKRHIESCMYD